MAPFTAVGGIVHHAADMTVTASADVTLAALQGQLAASGQWLPIDGDPDLPLGRLVLRNSTGPLRLGYGAWRDVLLGMQFRNGDDELITAGGRVVKNVAGYDLTKFIVGSYGIFGTPVTLTTRTWKRPTAALRVVLPPDGRRFATLMPSPLRPHWAVLTPRELVLGYHGDERAIELIGCQFSRLESTRVEPGTIESDAQFRARVWPVDWTWRASVPPTAIERFASVARLTEWSADPAFGILVGRVDSNLDRDALHRAAGEVGGSAVVLDSTDRPEAIACNPGAHALLVRLKRMFDPNLRLTALPPNRNE
jgi:hypothetical protein